MTPTGFHRLALSPTQLTLSAVLHCGQSFRWTSHSTGTTPAHEYRFCLRDRLVCLRQSPDALFYRAIFPDAPLDPAQVDAREQETLAWLSDYFQLDVDLVELYDRWSERDPVFRNVRSRFPGVRILRQDPWETLVSFICSSNNNIARITRMVHALCEHYSPPLLSLVPPDSTQDATYHPFPTPSALAAPEVATTLRSLGFGYRADFIQRTAKMLVDEHSTETPEKWLASLRNSSTPEARQELLKFVGVGRKVADCILLMSLDKREVVPVDTHVHQIVTKHYGFRSLGSSKKVSMTPKLYDEINSKLTDTWGDYAGWAHSVLFTADLKTFSSYGMTPNSTPTATPARSPSSAKRTRNPALFDADELPVMIDPTPDEDTSLAERVKKRRRAV